MYFVYTCALAIGLVLALPYFALRFRKYLPTVTERMGYIEQESAPGSVWVHAVSVGEVRSVHYLIDRLRIEHPRSRLIVSTTTPTGRELVRQRADVDRVVYFPLDLPLAVRRSLDRIRPGMVIVAETEIWPNFLRECGHRRIPVFMVNGRISDRSFARYRLGRRWLARVLDGYRLLGMQSETDASRIRAMGAPPGKVLVFGNLKYDLPRGTPLLDQTLRDTLEGYGTLIVAASTAEGEEPLILEAYRTVARNRIGVRLLIAPRLPERFDAVEQMLRSGRFSYCRRSALPIPDGPPEVLLLDSIGELNSVFEHAAVVFIGGTLVPRGGHNLLEPALFAKPILFGPHMENFRDMAQSFLQANAAIRVANVDELTDQISSLLDRPAIARSMGLRARQILDENAGATDQAFDAILRSIRMEPGPTKVAR